MTEPRTIEELAQEIRDDLPPLSPSVTALDRLVALATRTDESCALCYEAARNEGRLEERGASQG